MDYKHTLDYLGNQVESPQDIIPKGIRRCDDPLLCIPRDLALHWGPLYKSNHYGEWHYFSMIGKEENGDDFSLFYVVRSTGWCEQIHRPGFYTLFGYANLTKKKYYKNFAVHMGEVISDGDLESTDDKFFFKYGVGQPADKGDWFSMEYAHKDMCWKMQSQCHGDDKGNVPFAINGTAKVLAPGYVPASYCGFELGGYDGNARYNPATAYGITYYIIAPRCEWNVDVFVDGEVHHLKGTAWYEQQYGNCMTKDNFFTHYVYGHCRLKNGDLFTYRQNYGWTNGRFSDPKRDINRWMYLARQGGMDVRLGKDAFSYEIMETWESPQTGLVFPVKFLMDTPIGRLWVNVKGFYGQELQLHIGSMYEVPLEFRKNGPEGEVIGEGFGEAMSLVAFAENSPLTSLANQPDQGYTQPGW